MIGTLNAVVPSLAMVDDALRNHYRREGDRYVLQIEGIDDHPDVVSLKNGHIHAKRERDEARKERDQARSKLETVRRIIETPTGRRSRS